MAVRRYLILGKRRFFRLWLVDPARRRAIKGTAILADWEMELLATRRSGRFYVW